MPQPSLRSHLPLRWWGHVAHDGWWIKVTRGDGLMVHRPDGTGVVPLLHGYAWLPATPHDVTTGITLMESGVALASASLPGHMAATSTLSELGVALAAHWVSGWAEESPPDRHTRLAGLLPDLPPFSFGVRCAMKHRGPVPVLACLLAAAARGLDLPALVDHYVPALGRPTVSSMLLKTAARDWTDAPDSLPTGLWLPDSDLHMGNLLLARGPHRFPLAAALVLGLPAEGRRLPTPCSWLTFPGLAESFR